MTHPEAWRNCVLSSISGDQMGIFRSVFHGGRLGQPILGLDNRFWVESRHSPRSEEHTSELQSLMRIAYAVFCSKKKNSIKTQIEMIGRLVTFVYIQIQVIEKFEG